MLEMETSLVSTRVGPRLERALQRKKTVIDTVVNTVAQASAVTAEDIFGPSRRADIARARHIAAYLIFTRDPSISYRTIALGLRRNDHTTVMNSVMRVEELMRDDPDFKNYIDEIATKFG